MEEVANLDIGALAKAQTEFVLNLYKTVTKQAPNENAVLSPLSISLALAMVAAGAKGSTLEQMASCLKLPPGEHMHKYSAHLKNVLKADASKQGLELTCANSIWVDKTVQLKPSFQKMLKDSYGSEPASVDFRHKSEEARQRVNTWGEDETHGKIAEIIPAGALHAATTMVLANAIYFKGAWATPFDSSMTDDEDFHLLNGNTIKVPMMRSNKDQYMKSYPSFKALRLPYKLDDDTKSFSLFVLLPHDRNGLLEMESNLDNAAVVDDLSRLDQKSPLKRFQLPKFKISFGLEVSDTLKTLGMELPFGEHADLSNMTQSDEPLAISSVRHKAFVEVNEVGTEAAAVTTIEIMLMSMPFYTQEPDSFVADHPFMFLIKEESTNTILFTGRVLDPSRK